MPDTPRIRALNDQFRKSFLGGQVVIALRVQALSVPLLRELVHKVQSFDQFSQENDPHGEHDFVSVEVAGEIYFAKIDYYDPSMTAGSEDPGDPAKTTRVLTIMHSSEY